MKNVLKYALPALGLPLLLAACGGTAITPDGSVSFNKAGNGALRTEFKNASGQYVACDSVNKLGGGSSSISTVGVYYSATGNIQSLQIGLRGSSGASANDDNYNVTLQGSDLKAINGSNYRTVFTADSTTGFLPQAIVVNPNPNVAVKTVTTSGNSVGSFYAALTLTTTDASGVSTTVSTSSNNPVTNATIPVFTSCTETATTAETL